MNTRAGERRLDRRWTRAVREHRAALAAFVRFAGSIPAERWVAAPACGKWTPAEVTEHLSLSYEAALREIEGGAAMALRVTGVRQALFRLFLLPHILFHRRLPTVRAPRETRPAATPLPRDEQVERLRNLAVATENAFTERPDARLTHPYFGAIGRVRTLRLAALHLEHHQRLLSAVLT